VPCAFPISRACHLAAAADAHAQRQQVRLIHTSHLQLLLLLKSRSTLQQPNAASTPNLHPLQCLLLLLLFPSLLLALLLRFLRCSLSPTPCCSSLPTPSCSTLKRPDAAERAHFTLHPLQKYRLKNGWRWKMHGLSRTEAASRTHLQSQQRALRRRRALRRPLVVSCPSVPPLWSASLQRVFLRPHMEQLPKAVRKLMPKYDAPQPTSAGWRLLSTLRYFNVWMRLLDLQLPAGLESFTLPDKFRSVE
jgi:hypothetical protein